MDKRDKTIYALVVLVILMLAAGMWIVTAKIATIQNDNTQKIAEIRQLVARIEVLKGDTGLPGIGTDGKNGRDGRDGRDSVSTHTETTIIKERAIQGEKGEKGDPAPAPAIQLIQLNQFTGDLETKLSTEDFWTTLIPCNRLLVGCTPILTMPSDSGAFASGL